MLAFFVFDIMAMLTRGLQRLQKKKKKSSVAVHKCACAFPHDIILLLAH